MTKKNETVDVPTSVRVIYCDGPECNNHLQLDRYGPDHDWPRKWYKVELRTGAMVAAPGTPPPQTEWHFHHLACLRAWAKEHAYEYANE